jgi:hypothetical protein
MLSPRSSFNYIEFQITQIIPQVPASRMLLASDPVYPRALGDIHPHDPVPRLPSNPRRFYVVVVGIKIGVFYDTL